MAKKSQHVVPSGSGWSVKKAGAAKASSKHSTQADAVKAATTIAKNQKTGLFVHGQDGRIRKHSSFVSPSGSKK